jgi:hypothetical protein
MLKERRCPLFVDLDDASPLDDEQSAHSDSLRHLLAQAHEAWFSTPALAMRHGEEVAKARVVPDALDPRLWRNYRRSIRTSFSDGPIRFVYLGTGARFEMLMPALDRLAEAFPERFDVTLLGPKGEQAVRPWLKHVRVIDSAFGSPGFVRWLAGHADYDVGLAPAPASVTASDSTFLHQSALGLLSLVSKGPAYADVVAQGLAIGCADTADAWYEAMATVVKMPERMAGMRQRALDYVWSQRSTLANMDPLIDILARAVSSGTPAAFTDANDEGVVVRA